MANCRPQQSKYHPQVKSVLIIATGPVERNIIFLMTPTMFGIGAGVITVIAGVLSLPGSFPNLFETNDVALAMTTRGWLRVQAWAVFVASLVLLVVGLKIWTLTLDEKDNILAAYTQTSPNTIEALEERVEPPTYKVCSY
jgi:hypothetical protein